jgi:zinc/manganese transport system substrate-binding protein
MQSNPADAIIYAAYQSPRSAHWLSERTGIKAVKLPFTVGGIEGVDDLFALYDETLRLLEQATQ